MAALGWVIASAPDETSLIDKYWDGDEFVPTVDSAEFFSQEAGVTVQTMRYQQGDFQQRFNDVDIRMAEAQQTITLSDPAAAAAEPAPAEEQPPA